MVGRIPGFRAHEQVARAPLHVQCVIYGFIRRVLGLATCIFRANTNEKYIEFVFIGDRAICDVQVRTGLDNGCQ